MKAVLTMSNWQADELRWCQKHWSWNSKFEIRLSKCQSGKKNQNVNWHFENLISNFENQDAWKQKIKKPDWHFENLISNFENSKRRMAFQVAFNWDYSEIDLFMSKILLEARTFSKLVYQNFANFVLITKIQNSGLGPNSVPFFCK